MFIYQMAKIATSEIIVDPRFMFQWHSPNAGDVKTWLE